MTIDIIIKCTISTNDIENVDELIDRLEGEDITMEIDSGLDIAELTLDNVSVEDV